jgi:hypothetical protein
MEKFSGDFNVLQKISTIAEYFNFSRHFRFFYCLSLFCFFPAFASAQTQPLSEYQVKAVFIYKFCLYVEWPPGTFEDASSPVTIGVVDADEVAAELEAKSKNRTIDGRPLAVRRLNEPSSLDKLQLLFIAHAQENTLAHWMELAQKYPVLVITETPTGLDAGSSINFALQDNKVRFDVELAAAQRQGLKLSAQLLKVARTVRGETR